MKRLARTSAIRLRSPWVPVLMGLLVLLQATNPSRVWQYLLTGVVVVLITSAVWARHLRDRLVAERRVLWSWAQVGDLLEEEFVLRNQSPLPVVWAEVVDHSTVPGHDVSRVESVPGRGQRTWRAQSTCRLRGHFRLGPWELRTGDPFGVFEVTYSFPDQREVVVFPPVVRVPELTLPRGMASGSSRSLVRAMEATVDVSGVRPYQPGDALSRVHWPTSARHNTLLVREFDREPTGSLWVMLDLDETVQAGRGEESTAEYGVILAASIAHLVLRENRPVGLYVNTQPPVVLRPALGMQHIWAIMRELTSVQPRPGPHLAEALEDWGRLASREASLAVITPSTVQDWLAPLTSVSARGMLASITLLDAASFDSIRAPAEGLVSALAEMHVTARVVRSGMQFEHLVPLAYRGVLRFKVGGSGRAVAIRERRPEPKRLGAS